MAFFTCEKIPQINFSHQNFSAGNNYSYDHWRPTGLKSVGARIYKISGRGRKSGTFICIISGRGRKTVGASAPTAPIRWAPLYIII